MLSYRHGFHAGNFADVFKHAVLCLQAEALVKKDKPLFCLDTHAGSGRYDLNSAMAAKNREYLGGIGRLWRTESPPAEFASYLDAIRRLNHGSRLRFYPGSPELLRQFLRAGDRMVLCELHGSDAAHLRQEYGGDIRADKAGWRLQTFYGVRCVRYTPGASFRTAEPPLAYV
jgi:23S rRNA (adenine2030-N6)-methyltransferase